MLSKFAVTNFRGFLNRIEWDLSNPNGYDFNKSAIKKGILKNGIIYGPNGSGKTSLGLAIFDIANHLSHKWTKPDYYLNFASAYANMKPVDFEYSFVFDGKRLDYSYSKRAVNLKGEILKERLLVNNEELIYRENAALRLSKEFSLSKDAIANLKDSANNISLVNYLIGAVPLPQDHVLLQLRDFVERMLFFRSLESREFIGLKEGRSNIEEYIIKNGLVEDFSKFLKETSDQEYIFKSPKQNGNVLMCETNGAEIPFRLVASTGTRNLELQYYWLKEMKNSSFVYVDEFDAFYHHKLSMAICRLLFKVKGQTFTSTHNTYLMTNDLLRPDCYFILDKGKIRPLSQCTEKELREAHNIEKIYRGGGFHVE
ncbi:MAG: ATP-binding protein [Prevotella sp.]|nr:ATP-binding protein [Prevotella sp.]